MQARPSTINSRVGSRAASRRCRSRFRFSAFGLRAPDLLVETQLSTGQTSGNQHRAEGRRLDASGQGRLVGVALVPATGAAVYDRFLGLPAEALAVLECRLQA